MKEDEDFLIILGWPLLSTVHALVDIHDSKLTLQVENEKITFRIKKKSVTLKHNNDEVFFMEEVDKELNKEYEIRK